MTSKPILNALKLIRFTILCLFLALAISLGAKTATPASGNAFQMELFDLVSLNHAFIINLMDDFRKIQSKAPLQQARLDVIQQHYPWFRVGAASFFLYETSANHAGEEYQPQAFTSLMPMGFQIPVKSEHDWQVHLFGMFYWANYIDKKTTGSLTFQDYFNDYPKLAEAGVEFDLSSLITASAGYRKQFWDSNSEHLGSFAGINPDRDYTGWYAEINIGLQSLYQSPKTKLAPAISPRLDLQTSESGMNILAGNDSLRIPVTLSNIGRFSAAEIKLTLTNEMDLPVTATVSPDYIDRLNAGEEVTVTLSVSTDPALTRSTSGNLILYAIDKKGNTADCLIPIMLEP